MKSRPDPADQSDMTWVDLPLPIWLAVLAIAAVVALVCLHTAASQIAYARDVRKLRREAEALRIEYQRRLRQLRGEHGNAGAHAGDTACAAAEPVDVIEDDEIIDDPGAPDRTMPQAQAA